LAATAAFVLAGAGLAAAVAFVVAGAGFAAAVAYVVAGAGFAGAVVVAAFVTGAFATFGAFTTLGAFTTFGPFAAVAADPAPGVLTRGTTGAGTGAPLGFDAVAVAVRRADSVASRRSFVSRVCSTIAASFFSTFADFLRAAFPAFSARRFAVATASFAASRAFAAAFSFLLFAIMHPRPSIPAACSAVPRHRTAGGYPRSGGWRASLAEPAPRRYGRPEVSGCRDGPTCAAPRGSP
jgi:hypothetical protein